MMFLFNDLTLTIIISLLIILQQDECSFYYIILIVRLVCMLYTFIWYDQHKIKSTKF